MLAPLWPASVCLAVDELSAASLALLQGHQASVKKLAWTPSGRLISGDSKGNVFVWDVEKKRELNNFNAGLGFVRTLELFDQGKRYLVCVNNSVTIGSVASGREIEKMGQPKGVEFNQCAASSPDGKIISTLVSGRIIVHYSASNGKVVSELEPPGGSSDIRYTADGRLVVCGSNGLPIWVYEPGRTKPSFTIALSVSQCRDMQISPDGRWLAAVGAFGAQICQMRASAQPERLQVGDKQLEGLAWSPDSERVVTAGAGGLVQFWETRSGKLKQQLQVGIGESCALAFSQDGRWLAIGGGDYVDMTKSPPRQEINDKSIRLLELNTSAKPGLASTTKPADTSAATEVILKLRTFQQQFEAAVIRTGGDAYKQQLLTARTAYQTQLDTEVARAASAGNLELAVALRDEKALLQKAGELAALHTTAPAELSALRDGYQNQIQSLAKARTAALQPLFDKYDQMLATYQDDLTKRQRLEEALQVKERRTKLAEERKGESVF